MKFETFIEGGCVQAHMPSGENPDDQKITATILTKSNAMAVQIMTRADYAGQGMS